MSEKKQTTVYLSADNAAKLEHMRKKLGKTKSEMLNDLLNAAGKPFDRVGRQTTAVSVYTEFLSMLETYLIECIERDIIEKDTRYAAASFYEHILKELAKHTQAAATMQRMSVQN